MRGAALPALAALAAEQLQPALNLEGSSLGVTLLFAADAKPQTLNTTVEARKLEHH